MKKLRAAVISRDGRCLKCGTWVDDGCAVHHRKLRSQGGQDTMSNLITLCHRCHNLGTESVHLNPEQSYRTGFLVRGSANPADVPLLLFTQEWVVLDDTGSRQRQESSHVGSGVDYVSWERGRGARVEENLKW